ncbi:hypothetical protein [Actinoplanes sp. NPDC020271]|uniref:hypothetical protein n=1 Tax=Actinoplanes sp. NPDC020271 TaxID=3363896 RepID=UPI0037A445CE
MSSDDDRVPAPPSADWELAGKRTIRFAIAYALVAVLVVPSFAWATRNPVGGVTVAAAVVIVGIVLSALLLGALLGLVVCAVVWLVQTARPAYGSPSAGHLGYWGIGAFVLLFAAAYVRPGGLRLADALLLAAGERLLGVILLIAGVAHTRRWIRRRSGTDVPVEAQGVMSGQVTAEGWSTGWDPDVARDIERRRRG